MASARAMLRKINGLKKYTKFHKELIKKAEYFCAKIVRPHIIARKELILKGLLNRRLGRLCTRWPELTAWKLIDWSLFTGLSRRAICLSDADSLRGCIAIWHSLLSARGLGSCVEDRHGAAWRRAHYINIVKRITVLEILSIP